MPDSILAVKKPGWFELRFVEDHKKVHSNCAVCGRSMWLPKSKSAKYVTCGGACAEALRASRAASRQKQCETCSRCFTPRTTQIADGQGRFCSQKCNVASQAAMNSAASQEKSKKSWKATNAANPIVKSGAANPMWKGGKPATYQRRFARGAYREAWNKRRVKGGQAIESGIAQKLGGSQKWMCVVCRCDIKDGYHLDHIMPLALGGTNASVNLQLLCPACNRKKHAKHPVDFMQSQGFLL